MSENARVTGELDRLLSTLDTLLEPSGTAPQANGQTPREPAGKFETPKSDAIDAVLAAPARTSAVRSLRSSPEIGAFREALIDGLIRADTANQLLRLVNEVVGQLIK